MNMTKRTPQQIKDELKKLISEIELETGAFVQRTDARRERIERTSDDADRALATAAPRLQQIQQDTELEIDELVTESIAEEEKEEEAAR
jgi:hypothetical protein